MKFLNIVLPTLLLITMCVVFTACQDDRTENTDDNLNLKIDENMLINNAWVSNNSYDLSLWGVDNATLRRDFTTLYFLGNGKGIGKDYSHENDTYFGVSRNTTPFSFEYQISGTTLKIGNKTLNYQGDKLITVDGSQIFNKTALDIDWLESAKYYVLPDNERYNFSIVHGSEKKATFYQGSKKQIILFLHLAILAKEKAYSRGVNGIKATYTISGGTFSSSPSNIITFGKDEDKQSSCDVVVTTASQATITATFSIFDYKKKKEITMHSTTYSIS